MKVAMSDKKNTLPTQVSYLEVARLQPNPFQPRSKILEDEKFAELVSSIAQHGIIEPLVVVDTPAGLHIIAGERRWRAAKKNNLTQVPVHLIKTTPKGMFEMAIVENLQRVNLTALERAQAFQRLVNEFGYSYDEVAKKIGKSAYYVECSLRLLKLPDPVKDGLNKGLISEGHARAILGAGSEKDIMDCYRTVIAESASVRRAEALARFYRRQNETVPTPVKSKKNIPSVVDVEEYAANWQKNWQDKSAFFAPS